MQAAVLPTENPLTWLSNHWAQLAGWSVLATILGRIYLWITKLIGYGDAIASVQSDVSTIMTNHLPHLNVEVVKINDNLLGLRSDTREGFANLSRDLGIVLTRIE